MDFSVTNLFENIEAELVVLNIQGWQYLQQHHVYVWNWNRYKSRTLAKKQKKKNCCNKLQKVQTPGLAMSRSAATQSSLFIHFDKHIASFKIPSSVPYQSGNLQQPRPKYIMKSMKKNTSGPNVRNLVFDNKIKWRLCYKPDFFDSLLARSVLGCFVGNLEIMTES